MNNMVNKAQGFGLSMLTKIAGSEILDQLKLRKFIEKSLYQSSKAGFKTLSQTQKILKSGQKIQKQRLPPPGGLVHQRHGAHREPAFFHPPCPESLCRSR